MPDMPGMVRRLGRESTARRLGFARLGRLESWMLESGMHNSDRHHSTDGDNEGPVLNSQQISARSSRDRTERPGHLPQSTPHSDQSLSTSSLETRQLLFYPAQP